MEFVQTNPGRRIHSIQQTIGSMLDSASKSVKICSFIITDKKIVQKIVETGVRLKGHVYCITVPEINYLKEIYEKDTGDIESAEDLEVLYHNYKRECIDALLGKDAAQSFAAAIRGHSNAHAKFMIIDDAKALITSANFTTHSLFKKYEIGIFTEDINIVTPLNQLFNDLFLKRYAHYFTFQEGLIYEWKQFPYPQKLPLPKFNTKLPNSQFPDTFIWTYDFTNRPTSSTFQPCVVNAACLKLMKNENKRLDYFAYDYNELEGTDFLAVLIEKVQNEGVAVRMLTKNNFMRREESWVEKLVELATNYPNFEVRTQFKLHGKGIIASNSFLMFTGNFSNSWGLRGDFEVGVISCDAKLKQKVIQFYEGIWQRSTPWDQNIG